MEEGKVLESLGLDEAEAEVYLELLRQGEATATKLSEKTGLDRTLMYRITNKLIEAGFASYVIKNNVKYFLPADPEVFLEDIHKKEESFKGILPSLKDIQKTTPEEAKVEVYRGAEGINTILKMLLRDKKPYCIIGGAETASKNVKLINEIFVRRLEKADIPGKLIENKKADFFVGKNERFRLVSSDLLMSTSTLMWGDKTAVFVWSKPYYAILIQNPEITKSNLSHFHYLWKIAEEPTREERKRRLLR